MCDNKGFIQWNELAVSEHTRLNLSHWQRNIPWTHINKRDFGSTMVVPLSCSFKKTKLNKGFIIIMYSGARTGIWSFPSLNKNVGKHQNPLHQILKRENSDNASVSNQVLLPRLVGKHNLNEEKPSLRFTLLPVWQRVHFWFLKLRWHDLILDVILGGHLLNDKTNKKYDGDKR